MARSLFPSLSVAVLALVQTTVATESFPLATRGDGFLSIPVGHLDRPRNPLRRRNPLEAGLLNQDTFYTIDISLGNPPQIVSVLLDTGSSDLWVSPSCTATSFPGVSTCELMGSYQPSRSRTVDGPIGEQTLHYGDPTDAGTQTSVTLSYFVDALTIADATVENQIFGVMTEGVEDMQGIAGIFGLAPDLNAGFAEGEPYSLVLNSMVDQGIINSRAFALDLRHAESETGAVIYGGLDVKKYVGKLARFPLQPGLDGEARLAVSLSTIGTTRSRRTTHAVRPESAVAILDSGTTLTRLHPRLARPILEELDASIDSEGFFLTPCTLRSTASTVDFGFGEPGEDPDLVLRIRVSDFILDMPHPLNSRLCYVGLSMTDHQQILGDSVLRGGYFVFDWDNAEVHIAQAADCGSEVVAIGEGTDAVPDVEGKCVLDEDGRPTEAPTAATEGGDSLPTTPFTSTYTITECPSFDRQCTPGMVTTQTFFPIETGDDTDGGEGDEDDEGAARGAGGLLRAWVAVAAGLGGVYMVMR